MPISNLKLWGQCLEAWHVWGTVSYKLKSLRMPHPCCGKAPLSGPLALAAALAFLVLWVLAFKIKALLPLSLMASCRSDTPSPTSSRNNRCTYQQLFSSCLWKLCTWWRSAGSCIKNAAYEVMQGCQDIADIPRLCPNKVVERISGWDPHLKSGATFDKLKHRAHVAASPLCWPELGDEDGHYTLCVWCQKMLLDRATERSEPQAGFNGSGSHKQITQSINEYSVFWALIQQNELGRSWDNVLVCKKSENVNSRCLSYQKLHLRSTRSTSWEPWEHKKLNENFVLQPKDNRFSDFINSLTVYLNPFEDKNQMKEWNWW